jgi:tetratricopeptide (TPR) repeat protein
VNAVEGSGIENYFSLDFLSSTYLKYYKSPSRAKVYAERLITKYPDIITGYYTKARSLDEENDYEAAITEYLHALGTGIQCEYYQAAANERLAAIQYALGRKDRAAEYAVKALEIHRQYWIPDEMNERIQKLEKIKNKQD